MDFKSASKKLILALASGSFALTAVAQWQWIDKDGRKVYSDRAPPNDLPAQNILQHPAPKPPPRKASAPGEGAGAESAAAAASAAAPKGNAPKISGKDTELEARKKETEDKEAAAKKTEDDKRTRARADNCERAKKALVTMQSGVRISTASAKGEREFMDDTARAAEVKHLQSVVDGDCKR